MGGPKVWTPADQKPLKIFGRNLLGVIRSWASYKRPILVKIGPRGFSRHIREMYTPSGFFLTFFFLGSSTRVQPRPLDRFSRGIRQKTCFCARKALLGSREIKFQTFTPKIPQNPIFGVPVMHFLWESKMSITFEP